MSRGEVARLEDGWGVGDEGSSSGELSGMGREAESNIRTWGTMNGGVQRLCLLPV